MNSQAFDCSMKSNKDAFGQGLTKVDGLSVTLDLQLVSAANTVLYSRFTILPAFISDFSFFSTIE